MVDSVGGHPAAGVDYPRTLVEFDTFFPDEAACREFLERLRWPKGFVCPACGRGGPDWRMESGLHLCPGCRRQVSVTAGTLFEKTRKPLRQWFLAVWEIASAKYGASALGMQRVLGLRSYETAWAWLHKLRRAMVRPGRDQLSGAVEVDETYVGGTEEGVHGRETHDKAIVAVAAEVRGRAIGRIRLRVVPDVAAGSLLPFVEQSIAPGSVVVTDGWSGYEGLSGIGYQHRIYNLRRSGKQAHELLPRVHRVASLLKRWLLGTHQGAASTEHLPYYLDEFTFRFNRRTARARGLLFYRLLEQAVRTAHVETDSLFLATGRGRRRRPRGRGHKR
jgi:transposase-like protein